MQTTYRLHSQEIGPAFIQSLKSLFIDQEIEITVKPVGDSQVDEVTQIAQVSLAAEWESEEDQRWDDLLK